MPDPLAAPPAIFDGGGVPIAVQHDPSPVTNPGIDRPADRGPNISNEVGASEDIFEVYWGESTIR